VSNVADYMTRKSEEPGGLPPSDWSEHRERSSAQYNARMSPDKLMPSNEPC